VLAGRNTAQKVAASQLLKRVAEHLTTCRVGIDEAPLGIDDRDPVLGADHHACQHRQTERSGVRERGIAIGR